MRFCILLIWPLFLFSQNEPLKLVCTDGTELYLGGDIYSIYHKIDSISYGRKEFKASVEDGCYKGSQLLLFDKVYSRLDRKIKKGNKHIRKKYEFTAFQFKQGENVFSINVTDDVFIHKFCCNIEKINVIAQALVFKIYSNDKIYDYIIIEKVQEEK